MNWLYQTIKDHPGIQSLLSHEDRFAHLTLIQEALLLMGASRQSKQPLIVVKSNEQQARALFDCIQELDESVPMILYLQEESLRVEAIAPSVLVKENKANALYHAVHTEVTICITTVAGLNRKISSKQQYLDHELRLSLNDEITMKNVVQQLLKSGYQRVDRVDQPMTFASRGGVIDVFSVQEDLPLRIEFFDTVIEGLRYFDLSTQRTVYQSEQALIVPVSDMLLASEQLETIEKKVNQHLLQRREKLDKAAYDILHDLMTQDIENLRSSLYDASLYPYFSFLDETWSICDYFDNPLLIYSNQDDVKAMAKHQEEDTIALIQERVQDHRFVPSFTLFHHASDFKSIETVMFHKFQADDEWNLAWHELPVYKQDLSAFCNEAEKQGLQGRVIISVNTQDMKTLSDQLIKQNIPFQILIDFPKERGIYLEHKGRTKGFRLDNEGISVYSSQEIFGYVHKRTRYTNKFKEAETLSALSDLEVGDYVVHQQYGIGKYLGIVTKEIEGIHKDFLHIAYRNEDVLLVPLEQFTLVRKYVSREAVAIRLSKLGSNEWTKTKDRIKASVSDIADKLIEVYALRKRSKGFAFSPDGELHQAFDEEFDYELTADQALAIAEVKRDMESSQPMDRLLCGDVGFGKTEVAIRAAFKAVYDKKQVVYLCPTTILSSQHFQTFTERFKNFPVRIEVLNRFVAPARQKEIIAAVKAGTVDIVIGTHRVLSRDLKFKDLGLLIIDEEQRFGVEHKERIKALKVNIDVLSLSATPIPRTLQMSLIGLRSLSQLNTPPSNRLPVMTYVVERNQQLIEDIITKELNRNGQVFYLFNNIERISSVAFQVQRKINGARVAIIHGQMDRDEIEATMQEFHHNEINVLICTTIIETGIDIPNANTMIIENAQNFGLSQLYQIKGRVGRSDRLAYTYLLVPEKKQLSEVATKRLEAIKEFTQLGSGYKIAMRDLTIRGAGELLGGNQSGFIDTVGIDMYIELLQEVIQEKQGIVKKEAGVKQSLNLPIDGYIPQQFTDRDKDKIELYQSIESIHSFKELERFYESISDIYGELPNEVNLLLEKKRLELALETKQVDSLKERKDAVEITFTEAYSSTVDGIALFELLNRLSRDITVKYQHQKIRIHIPKDSDWLKHVLYLLNHIQIKEEPHEN